MDKLPQGQNGSRAAVSCAVRGNIVTKEKKISLLAGAGMLLCAFIWGFAFVVVKTSLDMVPPVYMMAFRFTIAAAALCVVFFRRLKKITRETVRCGMVIGIFLFLAYLVQTIGCKYTTAGKNAFLTTIYVILVPFMHYFVSRKKISRYHIVAAFLAFTGIGLLSLQGDKGINIGDILTVFCGVLFTFQIVFIDIYTEREDPVLLTILQIGFAALFSWILAPVVEGSPGKLVASAPLVVSMLYLGLFSTMIAFLLQNVCQKYAHPAAAAVLLSMESVFGVLCSALFIGERMTPRMILGCVLMFAAIIIAQTLGNGKDEGVLDV